MCDEMIQFMANPWIFFSLFYDWWLLGYTCKRYQWLLICLVAGTHASSSSTVQQHAMPSSAHHVSCHLECMDRTQPEAHLKQHRRSATPSLRSNCMTTWALCSAGSSPWIRSQHQGPPPRPLPKERLGIWGGSVMSVRGVKLM